MNNPGFSGGPVALTRPDGITQICAVISGYRFDWQNVEVRGVPSADALVRQNTGIIIAYDIAHALEVF